MHWLMHHAPFACSVNTPCHLCHLHSLVLPLYVWECYAPIPGLSCSHEICQFLVDLYVLQDHFNYRSLLLMAIPWSAAECVHIGALWRK